MNERDIEMLEGYRLDEAICRTLGLEIDVFTGKVIIVFRMPECVRTFLAPNWASDASAAFELLSTFAADHKEYDFAIRSVNSNGVIKWEVLALRECDDGVSEIASSFCRNAAPAMCRVWLKAVASAGSHEQDESKFSNSIGMIGDHGEHIVRRHNGRTYIVVENWTIHVVPRTGNIVGFL